MLTPGIRFRQGITRLWAVGWGSGSRMSVVERASEGAMIAIVRVEESTLSFVLGSVSMMRRQVILLAIMSVST